MLSNFLNSVKECWRLLKSSRKLLRRRWFTQKLRKLRSFEEFAGTEQKGHKKTDFAIFFVFVEEVESVKLTYCPRSGNTPKIGFFWLSMRRSVKQDKCKYFYSSSLDSKEKLIKKGFRFLLGRPAPSTCH